MGKLKENDWFLSQLINPDMNFSNFEEVGLSAGNTSIESEDTYKNIDLIRNSEAFQTDGTFDDAKFHKFYEDSLASYNKLAIDTANNDLMSSQIFYKDDLFAPEALKNYNSETTIIQVPNPFKLQIGTLFSGSISSSPFSTSEIAQLHAVLLNPEEVDFEHGDFSNAKWGDSINEMSLQNSPVKWAKNFFEPLVLATWDSDGEHINPMNGNKETHKKGEYKYNQNGDVFYENLNGRDVYGKQVLSKWDNLTIDGTPINTFDFFDSDDKEKSLKGTLMREAVEIIPMFTPAAPVYLGTRVFLQTAGLLSTIGKMIGDNAGWDTSALSTILGINESLSTSTSEHALQVPWSMENIINMAGDVVGLLAEQRFLFKYLPKAFLRDAPITEEALAAKQEEYISKYISSLSDALLSQVTKDELAAAATSAAKAQVKQDIKNYLKLGERLSKIYMTGITVADSYGDAKEAGASDAEAALLTLGYAAGEWGILSTDIGKWILPELKADRLHMKSIGKALIEGRKEAEVEGVKEMPLKWIQKLLSMGSKIAHADYAGVLGTKAIVANALGEGVEETTEELLYDATKAIFNIGHMINKDGVDYEPFKDWGLRYVESFVGGVFGGAIGQINPDFRALLKSYGNMTYDLAMLQTIELIGEGKEEDLKKVIRSLPTNNQYLSASKVKALDNGTIIRELGNSGDNLDSASKDMVINTIDLLKNILDSHAASIPKSSLLHNHFEMIRDARILRMLNSIGIDENGEPTKNSGTVANYLQGFNTARTQLVAAELAYRDALRPKNTEGKTLEDSATVKYRLEHAEEIAKKKAEVDKYSQIVLDYLNGVYAPDFIRCLIKEMSPDYMAPYMAVNEIRFAEGMTGKKYSELDDKDDDKDSNTKVYWHKQWEAHKNAIYKDLLRNADTVSHNIASAWSPQLLQIQELYFKNKDLEFNTAIDKLIAARSLLFQQMATLDDDTFVIDLAERMLNKGDFSENVDVDYSKEAELLDILAEGDETLKLKLQEIRDSLSEENIKLELIKQQLILGDTFVEEDVKKARLAELDSQIKEIEDKLKAGKKIIPATREGEAPAEISLTQDEIVGLQESLKLLKDDLGLLLKTPTEKEFDEIRQKTYDGLVKLASLNIKTLLNDLIITNYDKLILPIIEQGYIHPELKGTAISLSEEALKALNADLVQYEYQEDSDNPDSEITYVGKDEKELKYVDSLVAKRTQIIENTSKLREMQSVPMLQIIDQFQLLIKDPTIKVSDLVKMSDELLSDPKIGNVALSNDNIEAIDLALNVIELMRSQLQGAATDNVGRGNTFSNLFGINATINALEKTYRVEESKRSNLVEVDTATANKMMQDLDPIRAKLMFLKRLNALNNSLKLADNHVTAGRFQSIMYHRFNTRLLGHLDDSWNVKKEGEEKGVVDKLKEIINESSTLQNAYDNPNLKLDTETRKKLEKLRTKFEDALKDLFDANQDKDLTTLLKSLDFMDDDSGLLHAHSTDADLSDAHFAYWLMAKALVKTSSFLKDYHKAILANSKVAPFAGLEVAVQLAYATAMNGDLASKWIEAISKVLEEGNAAFEDDGDDIPEKERKTADRKILDKWRGTANNAPTKLAPKDSSNVTRFLNTVLIEGVPGSGKSTGVATTLVSMLQNSKNGKELLSNVWLGHITDKKAQKLGDNIGVKTNAHYFDRHSFLTKISDYDSEEWDKKKNKNGEIVYDNLTVQNGLASVPNNIKEIDDSEVPSLIILDEIGRYTAMELDLIDKFALKNGVTVIALGDLDLSKAVATSDKPVFAGSPGYSATLSRGNFAHAPKLGTSIRPSNTYKRINQEVIQSNFPALVRYHLAHVVGNVGQADQIKKQSFPQGIKLQYFMDSTGVYGDRIILSTGDTPNEEVLKTLDTMVATSEEPIIFLTYDKANSKVAKYIETAKDEKGEFKYKDKIKVVDANDTQGDEGQYYIVEANQSSAGLQSEQFWNELYTGMSRAELASLIILPTSDIAEVLPYIKEAQLSYLLTLSLSDSQITQAIKERGEVIKSAIDDTIPDTEYTKRKNSHIVSVIETTAGKKDEVNILKGESGQIAVNLGSDPVNDEMNDEPEVKTLDGQENATLYFYSFNTLETGWKWDEDLGRYVAPKNTDVRIDGLNGLYKLAKAAGKTFKPSDGINTILKLRQLTLYVSDPSELLTEIKKLDLLSDIDGVDFAYKKSIGTGIDKNSRFDNDEGEKVLNLHTGSDKSEEIPALKLVMLLKKDGNYVEEIPLLGLPNYKTLLKAKTFAGLQPLYDKAVASADKYTSGDKKGQPKLTSIYLKFILELEKVSDVSKPNYIAGANTMLGLVKLYADQSNELILLNTENALGTDWTPRKAFANTGYVINTKKKGWDYSTTGYETVETASDLTKGLVGFMPLEEFKEDLGLTISPVSISATGSLSIGSTSIHFAKKGSPFVLYTDLKIDPTNIAQAYQKQITDYINYLKKNGGTVSEDFDLTTIPLSNIPDEFKRIKLAYVVPQEVSFDEYILNEAFKMVPEAVRKKHGIEVAPIGLDFDNFRILSNKVIREYLRKGAEKDDITKAQHIAAYKIVDQLSEILKQIDAKRGNARNTLTASQLQLIRDLLQKMIDILANPNEALKDIPKANEGKWATAHFLRKYLVDHFLSYTASVEDGIRYLSDNPGAVGYRKKFEKAIKDEKIRLSYNPLVQASETSGQILELTDFMQGLKWTVNGKFDSPVMYGNAIPMLKYLSDYVSKPKTFTTDKIKKGTVKFHKDILTYLGYDSTDSTGPNPAEENRKLVTLHITEFTTKFSADNEGKYNTEAFEAFSEYLKKNIDTLQSDTDLDGKLREWCKNEGRQYLKIGKYTYIGNKSDPKTANLIPDTSVVTLADGTGFPRKITVNLSNVTLSNGSTVNCIYEGNFTPGCTTILLTAQNPKIVKTIERTEWKDGETYLSNANYLKNFNSFLQQEAFERVRQIQFSVLSVEKNIAIKKWKTRKELSSAEAIRVINAIMKDANVRSEFLNVLTELAKDGNELTKKFATAIEALTTKVTETIIDNSSCKTLNV